MENKIKWVIDNQTTLFAIAGALYVIADVVVRMCIPVDKVEEWEKNGGIIRQNLAKIYRLLEILFAKNR